MTHELQGALARSICATAAGSITKAVVLTAITLMDVGVGGA